MDDEAADAHFAGIPGVESVDRRGQEITIRGIGHGLVTAVIQCLSQHRIQVTDFRTEHPGLEDVFLKLTGHSVRE
jgi:ABC-2 type transport system ATP-binding protein